MNISMYSKLIANINNEKKRMDWDHTSATWKEIFLESPSIYFLETSALGKTKWIKRKDSTFLTGKMKYIPGTNRDCSWQDFSKLF